VKPTTTIGTLAKSLNKDHYRQVDLLSHHHIVDVESSSVTHIISWAIFGHHNIEDDDVDDSEYICHICTYLLAYQTWKVKNHHTIVYP